jgi:hypothetical protein
MHKGFTFLFLYPPVFCTTRHGDAIVSLMLSDRDANWNQHQDSDGGCDLHEKVALRPVGRYCEINTVGAFLVNAPTVFTKLGNENLDALQFGLSLCRA